MCKFIKILLVFQIIFLEFIFSGCKTGGLIEFQEDENKPFITNRINIGNKILTVDLPFEFSAKFKKLPISSDEIDFLNKSEKATQIKDGVSFSILHNIFSNNLLPNIKDIGYAEALRITVDEDVNNIKRQADYKELKILNNKPTNFGTYNGREIYLSYVHTQKSNQKTTKLSTKAVYILFGNELLVIGFDFLTDDDRAIKIVNKTLQSIRIE